MSFFDRPVIVIDSFSFHSFASSGYFYCWELSKAFDVVLLVAEADVNSPLVALLQTQGRLARVVVVPDRDRRGAAHRWWAKGFPRLLKECAPALVFLSNVHSFHQKYIVRTARRMPGVRIVCFLAVQVLITDFHASDQHLVEARVAQWVTRWPRLPRTVVRMLHDGWGRWVGFRDFTLYPLLLTGRRLVQSHCPWQGRLFTRQIGHLFDAYLCYEQIERQGLSQELPPAYEPVLVTHPMLSNPDAVEALYSGASFSGAISVLPSRCAAYDRGECDHHTISRLTELWGHSLESLRKKTGPGPILWKLHPSFIGEPVMEAVTQALSERLPDFHSMTGRMTAEEMMVQSDVVVGDASTVLLWASRCPGKVVISLAIWDLADEDEMAHYPGIRVVRSLEELDALPADELKPLVRGQNVRPTVLEYLRDHLDVAGMPAGDADER